jgi:hypothetical protein
MTSYQTHFRDWSSDSPCFVAFPLSSSLQAPNVSRNVVRDGPSAFGRHEATRAKDTAKTLRNGFDESGC